MNRIPFLLPILLLFAAGSVRAQVPDMVYSPAIGAPQLFMAGNQMGYPIIRLNSGDQMDLQFDDLDGDVKNYSYTITLCNEDWTPAMVSEFDYIKGFSQVRIEDYRSSSIALTRYTHFKAVVPDPNCIPIHSGNYLLKVFLDGDTSKLAFTRGFLVTDAKISVQSQLLQPMDYTLSHTHQHIQFRLNTLGVNPTNPQDQIKVVILQNYRWDNAFHNIKPNFYVNNSLVYNNDNEVLFQGGSEWRWLDLQSFRYQSERVQSANYGKNSTDVLLKPDGDRSALAYYYYGDYNGAFAIQSTETIQDVNYQGDYATALFSFVPADKNAFPDKDVYMLGRFTGGVLNDSTRMVFNPDKGRYERRFLLKMGYYNYSYVTLDKSNPDQKASFGFTEGNHIETENDYMILVYYRAPGARADELVGISRFNSRTAK
jgi:hypothetical protein